MADPKKETKRERREVAKQRRLEEIRRRQRKARMRKLITIAVVSVAIVGLVGGIFAARASSNRKKEALRKAAAAGGCEPIKKLASEGRDHTPPYHYKTNPPTSGNHNPSTAPTGILSPAPPDENLVHNMEHGHVIFWYKPDLDPKIITGLQEIVRKDARRIILVPRAEMEAPLVFTAWARSQSCPSPKTETIATAQQFADSFKGKGPEGDRPGTPQGV